MDWKALFTSTRLRQRSVTNYSAAIAGQVQQLQLPPHLELIESQQIGTERNGGGAAGGAQRYRRVHAVPAVNGFHCGVRERRVLYFLLSAWPASLVMDFFGFSGFVSVASVRQLQFVAHCSWPTKNNEEGPGGTASVANEVAQHECNMPYLSRDKHIP